MNLLSQCCTRLWMETTSKSIPQRPLSNIKSPSIPIAPTNVLGRWCYRRVDLDLYKMKTQIPEEQRPAHFFNKLSYYISLKHSSQQPPTLFLNPKNFQKQVTWWSPTCVDYISKKKLLTDAIGETHNSKLNIIQTSSCTSKKILFTGKTRILEALSQR